MNKGSGKTILIKDYEAINKADTHNSVSMQVMLWKYDGGGPKGYILKDGKDNRHFDLGDDF